MGDHGTRATYKAGCRCNDCRAADAAYQQVNRVRRRQGLVGLVDATAARAHCFQLRAMNVGMPRIAKLASVDQRTVERLCAGSLSVLRSDIAAKILAVPPNPALGVRVVAHDTWRYIRLIKKELYTPPQIAKAIGRHYRLRIGRKWCDLSTALKVKRLYRSTQPADDPDTER